MIQAMPLLPVAVRLDIGGEGPLKGELNELIGSLGLENRVRLCGAIRILRRGR